MAVIQLNRKSYHHGNLEDALIKCAIKLISKNGPDHLSLRAVATEVGVSPSAAYHYFPDKQALISAIGCLLFADLAKMAETALNSIPGNSAKAAKARYREIGRAYFRWVKKEPNLFRLMFGGFCSSPKNGSHEAEPAYILLKNALDDLVQSGVITEQMRRYGELLSWTSVQGAANLIIEGHLPEAAFEELLDGLELALGIK